MPLLPPAWPIAAACHLISLERSWVISLIKCWNDSFLRSKSVDFWYFLMSMMALVPGLYLHFFLTSPGVGGSAFLFAGAFFGFKFLVLLVGSWNLAGPLWSQVPGHLPGAGGWAGQGQVEGDSLVSSSLISFPCFQ